jgi:hypothetical protein
MSLQRWAAKRDTAEQPIRHALEAVGARVTKVSGKGRPDLIVEFRGRIYVWEIKSGKGTRTKAQEASRWPIVRTPEAALKAIGAVR